MKKELAMMAFIATLSVQFLMNDRNQGKGVAKDNQGNVFKLTF